MARKKKLMGGDVAMAEALRLLVIELGAKPLPPDYALSHQYGVQTRAGFLALSVRPNATSGASVFGRFEDVPTAARVIGANPYSGKWNMHFWQGCTTERACQAVRTAFDFLQARPPEASS